MLLVIGGLSFDYFFFFFFIILFFFFFVFLFFFLMIRRPPRSTLFPTRRSSDLMALGASLLVVAKTIYLDILGPEQTSHMFQAFAEDLENHDYKKATIH